MRASGLLVALLVTADGLRAAICLRQQVGARFARTGRRAESAAARFALSRSHVENLCTEEVSRGACTVLDSPSDPDAKATAAQLADILAMREEGEAASLLEAIGLDGGVPFSCRAFCEAAVSSIPKILSIAAPPKAGFGCIDAACKGEKIDISADALAEDGLKPPPPSKGTDILKLLPGENASRQALSPDVQAELQFRAALNVVLGVFPAVDEIDGEEPQHSLLQQDRPPVTFGSDTRTSRHELYAEYVMKASAWIALALRKLRTGRHYTKKWFVLQSEAQVDAQEQEARRHMTRMLQLTSNVFIVSGATSECDVTEEAGTMAYVQTASDCNVQSAYDCGARDYEGRYVVHICEFFWGEELTADQRVGTLVHEASHHFGTNDNGYCDQVDCLALGSSEARENADSYLQLVSELVMDESLAKEAQGIKEELCNVGCDATQFKAWDFSVHLPDNHCGICAEKMGLIAGCGGSQIQVASRFSTKLCCKPVQCATTTTTTTTLLCPSGTDRAAPDVWGDCHCASGSYCSASSSGFTPCLWSNLNARGYQAFHAACPTCRCYPVKKPKRGLFARWWPL